MRYSAEDAGDSPGGDVRDVIRNAAAVGETRRITGQYTKRLRLAMRRRWQCRVEAKHIGHRPRGSSGGGDRRRIGDQRNRSVRGGRGMSMPYTAFSTRASSGSRSKVANWESFTGWLMLQKSLEPVR